MRKPKLVKLAALALASVCAIGLLAGCSNSSGSAPATSNGEHPTITINALNRNMWKLQDLVHEKYPEINLKIIPCNGANTSAYMTDMRKSGQMTDIFFNTVYTPGHLDDKTTSSTCPASTSPTTTCSHACARSRPTAAPYRLTLPIRPATCPVASAQRRGVAPINRALTP